MHFSVCSGPASLYVRLGIVSGRLGACGVLCTLQCAGRNSGSVWPELLSWHGIGSSRDRRQQGVGELGCSPPVLHLRNGFRGGSRGA